MTPPSRITGAVAAAAGALALALPGAASGAKAGSLTFQQQFPLASALCAKVAAGTESKHLQKFAVQLTADCAALQATFTQSQATVLATRAAILPTLTADRAAVHSACRNLKPKEVRLACVRAHRANDAAIKSLVQQLHSANHAYWQSVETARHTFWAEVKSLRGLKHVPADKPIPVPH
jgi:uncharacterized caspase-like protein